ncbi:MAG TPA: TraR/DksA C4-type zinc finger protein [Pseudomonadales bacterium]|nr:TraR/DksA C4-type zinc finger protein [Pseudomonadales bacterium]
MTDTAVKALLETKLAEYSARAEAIRKDLRHENEPLEKDSGEAVVQLENEEVLRGLLSEAEHECVLVANALSRLEKGHYGQCTHCGAEIEPARLKAIPEAERCMKCA